MTPEVRESTRFLNVDLDIYSKTHLKPLVSALGKEVFALHQGREGRLWSAHLELSDQPRSADEAIRRLSALIRSLPPEARRLWDAAKIRDFNVGVQGGWKPHARTVKLAPGTIRIASSLKARLVVTIYAARAFSNPAQ